MIKADKYFKDNLSKILNEGCVDENPRARYKDGGIAYSMYITQVFEEYDLEQNEFPITTLRNTALQTGLKEIKWIYMWGSNKLSDAKLLGINWWDEWNVGDGTIGKRYGYTNQQYGLYDKLRADLIKNPFGRRHVMNLWQEEHLRGSDGLYPCAYETIWSVRKKNGVMFLDMSLIQRSSDYIMAGFINKSQYVGLMMYTMKFLNTVTKDKWMLGKFCHLVQNLHIYDRHIDQAKEILSRDSGFQPVMYFDEEMEIKCKGINQGKKLSKQLEIAI